MSTSGTPLFNLLPALYRLKDAQIASAKSQLSATQAAQLAALQALPPPLTSAQQQQLQQLLAKAALGPLQSLMMLVQEQIGIVSEDLSQLYANLFIETCASWVIPYIGDLIGYQPVHGVAPAVASPRAEVAHTISFRRRKGTVLVLEQLARDVTGWGSHAVEFFRILADTQYMNHIRPQNHYAPDLRHWKPGLYMDTGFDSTAHKVDVRRIAVERGRYNIQNIGIFLWSLNAYSLTMSPVVPVPAAPSTCFRFNSLGRDAPLFNNPISQGSEITAAATPANVPDRLRRRVLCYDLDQIAKNLAPAVYYGNSLALYLNGNLLAANQIQVCDLSGEDGHWANTPPGSQFSAAIDPELGRIALPASTAGSSVAVTYYYGFNAEMGGGEYSRAASFTASPEQVLVQVSQGNPNLQGALDSLGGDGVVEITDSGQYQVPSGLNVNVKANGHIEFRAADGFRPTLYLGGEISVTGGDASAFDLNGFAIAYLTPSAAAPAKTPVTVSPSNHTVAVGKTVQFSALVTGIADASVTWSVSGVAGGSSTLGTIGSGGLYTAPSTVPSPSTLTITATENNSLNSGSAQVTVLPLALLHAPDNGSNLPQLSHFGVTHCTLVPGWALTPYGDPQPAFCGQPTLLAQAPGLQVVIQQSILGGLRIGGQTSVSATNSIVDATNPSAVAYAAPVNSNASEPQPGGALTLVGCTVIGKIYASLMSLVSDSICWAALSPADTWNAPLWAERKQQGCVRFSFIPAGSITPRQFECVVQGAGSPQPLFYSLRYGDPAYSKLLPTTHRSIRRGADDGGEMGAFHFVLAPLRDTDLRVRMQEYLPAGLEFGIFYET
jgi:hypothetical protein